jgi:hypothetical protein
MAKSSKKVAQRKEGSRPVKKTSKAKAVEEDSDSYSVCGVIHI